MDKRGKIRLLMIISLVLVSFLSIYFVLAQSGNYKEFEKTGLEYGKISILDSGNIKLAEYTLLDNSDQCLTNCYAEGTATLYTEGYLFSDLRFKDKGNNLVNINSNEILIEVDESYQINVNDYKQVCEDTISINGTSYKECNNVLTGSHTETRGNFVWNEYNNDILSAGTYKWRIEGKKEIRDERLV